MPGVREFFDTTAGKATAGVVILVGIVVAIYSARKSFSNEMASMSRERLFVDSVTGKGFEHTVGSGDRIPLKAPSGGNTGYPAELCYWTKDGKTKTDPTPVLLNSWVGKPGATFCPDCGRLVVPHNPAPAPGAKPPPTQAEYKARPAGGEESDR